MNGDNDINDDIIREALSSESGYRSFIANQLNGINNKLGSICKVQATHEKRISIVENWELAITAQYKIIAIIGGVIGTIIGGITVGVILLCFK